MNSTKNIVIKEFRYLYSHDKTESIRDDEGNYAIYRKHFQLLEDFILANKIEDREDAGEFLLLGSKIINGKRKKIIKAKNYVGVIQLKNGFTIEILPKIFEDEKELIPGENNNILNVQEYARTRKLFIKMLRTLKKAPFKHFEMANLKSARMPLYEIFILMFLDELTRLVRKGIKSAYLLQIENESFLKGKLKINEHLRKNYINKHKFYIEYGEYLQNRPENRLIKSTLLHLQKNSKVQQTQNRIRQFLFVFDEIQESMNYDSDFLKCKGDRLISYYEKTLNWCRIFLKNKSFINYRGNSAAFSLLFPMEKIFESYVSALIRKDCVKWDVHAQKADNYLIEGPTSKFQLKPDIVMNHKENRETKIIDTKWKKLSTDSKRNYGISQADLYQMYAYGKKIKSRTDSVNKLYLIYPFVEEINCSNLKLPFFYEIDSIHNAEENKLELDVLLIDLDSKIIKNYNKSIKDYFN